MQLPHKPAKKLYYLAYFSPASMTSVNLCIYSSTYHLITMCHYCTNNRKKKLKMETCLQGVSTELWYTATVL